MNIAIEKSNTYDVIIIGLGSMGSAASYYLSKQGVKVLGIEQFESPHNRGSHGGDSRIIRKAYFEHPDYVPLLQAAYHNWGGLERQTEQPIFNRTGLLYAGLPGHLLIRGIDFAAAQFGLPLERLDPENCESLYPVLKIPSSYEVRYEKEAGYLLPDTAISTYLTLALAMGLKVEMNTKVLEWRKRDSLIEVITDKGLFRASKLIVTSGPWLGQVVPSLKRHLQVTMQQLWWVLPKQPALFRDDKMPCWVIAHEHMPGVFYGFPSLPGDAEGAFKLAYHFPADPADPDEPATILKPDDEMLMDILHTYFPGDTYQTKEPKTCFYTNTPDEHFIIDFLPGTNQDVIIGGGFSGHGFKFVSIVGEILSDLVVHGKTSQPIDLFSLSRWGG